MWGTKGERVEHLRGQGISEKDIDRIRRRVKIGDPVRLHRVFEPDVLGRPYGNVISGTVVGKYPHLCIIQVGRGYTSFRWAELAADQKRG